MTRNLQEALRQQKKSTAKANLRIVGTLGLPINGVRTVEVPNRSNFVYVKLRDNQNEVIQAFNNTVAPSFGLPVIVERQHNRYVVIGVDTIRYQSNWNSNAPFLPRHGNTHSFDPDSGGGGDVVWVMSRQFMPSLIVPSGSLGAPNVVMSPYTLQNLNGTWKYTGNTGTVNLTPYKPTMPSGTTLVLTYLDTITGNPGLIFATGVFVPATITGSAQLVPYMPAVASPTTQIPLSVIRLVTGTSTIGWDNIYDVRQFLHPVPTGSGGGGGAGTIDISVDNTPLGSFEEINFLGNVSTDYVSGPSINIYITGSGLVNLTGTSLGEPDRIVGTNSIGRLEALPWLFWNYDVFNGNGYLKFGYDIPGQEVNAGVVGYQRFDNYFDIVGAGTGSTGRTVKIYDDLLIQNNTRSQSFSINDAAMHSKLLATNSTGTIVSGEPLFASGTYGRKDGAWESVIPENGWIFVSEAWTRVGAHSFTVSGDVTAKYRKGTRVKYNDPSLDYGVIASSSHSTGTTTVTLITNTDFSMAAATITGRYISYLDSPEGFPDEFAFTPTGLVNIGSGSQAAYWKTEGNLITIHGNIVWASNTTFNTSDLTLPVAMLTSYDITSNITPLGVAIFLDTGNASYLGNIRRQTDTTVRFQAIGVGATWGTTSAITSTVPFTWGNTDENGFQFSYLY